MSKKNKHRGSRFDDFLESEGVLAEVEAVAAKRAAALKFKALMERKKISKVAMAKQMGTSRPQLDRLLDPSNSSVTLRTLSEAAAALDCRIKLDIVPIRKGMTQS